VKEACVKEWLNPTKQAWLTPVGSFQKEKKEIKK